MKQVIGDDVERLEEVVEERSGFLVFVHLLK